MDCGKMFSTKQSRKRHQDKVCTISGTDEKQELNSMPRLDYQENQRGSLELSNSKSTDTNTKISDITLGTLQQLLGRQIIATVDAHLNQKDGGGEQNTVEEKKDPKIDIVCLAKGDYIRKLVQLHDGDEEKAMNYIKNIGIATDFLEGDFRMIKKVYFDGKKKSEFPIRIKDFKRNKLEYLEENGEWILDIRGEIVGKRLCENIVSTLLIANTQFNEIIINEKDEDKKELLLDLFQINKTQAHIMKLLERKTQGKLSKRVAEFINYCTEVHAETGSLDNVKKAYE